METAMDIIFDIDGTLANLTHRLHYIRNSPKNWGAFHKSVGADAPIRPVILLAQLLFAGREALGYRDDVAVILCSGRTSDALNDTVRWMNKHEVSYDALYMRASDDFRADYLVKKDLLTQMRMDGFNPVIAFDDRQQVVDMWRSNGIICAQVAPGDF